MKFEYKIIAFIVILSSCQSNESSRKSVGISFDIDLYSSNVEFQSPEKIVKDINFIQLKADKDKNSILAKPEKVYFAQDKFFIWDKGFTGIKVFSSNGTFEYIIGRLGRGPGELIKIKDFHVFDDSVILLADNTRLLHYNLEGVFIKEQKLNFFASQFEKNKKDQYVFFTNHNVREETGNFNVLYTDLDLKIIKKDFAFKNIGTPSYDFTGFLIGSEEGVFFSEPFDEIIYSINEEENIPIYKFNFGELKIPEKVKEDYSLFLKEGIKYSYLESRAFDNINNLFFTLKDDVYIHNIIFNKKNKLLYKYLPEEHDKNYINEFYSTPLGKTANGELITILSPITILYFIENNNINEIASQDPILFNILKNFKESDNPIIMIFKTE